MFPLSFMAMVGVVAGTLTISDPSDVVSPSNWEADNALFSDYTVAYVSPLPLQKSDRLLT